MGTREQRQRERDRRTSGRESGAAVGRAGGRGRQLMQTHRDTAETGLREVWAYLVLLRTQKFYGDVTIKFREGVVVGHVHEHRDHLVNRLPQATPEQSAEARQVEP